jgi:UDP-N-acetylglucosamine 1-carboxyvinyltransferase
MTTDNAVLCALSIPGETVITNSSEDSETEDLISLCRAMGAAIEQPDPKTIKIQGAKVFRGAKLEVQTDKTEAAVFASAALLTKGNVIIKRVNKTTMIPFVNFLNKMGAKISGAGTNLIEIEGVKSLHAVEHRIIPDRIEAGTLMVAAGLTRGNIKILHCPLSEMEMVVHKLRESGMEIEADGEGVRAVGTKEFEAWMLRHSLIRGFQRTCRLSSPR